MTHVRMYCHRHMRYHLVINKFILFGKKDISIQSQKLAKFYRFQNIDPLAVTVTAE